MHESFRWASSMPVWRVQPVDIVRQPHGAQRGIRYVIPVLCTAAVHEYVTEKSEERQEQLLQQTLCHEGRPHLFRHGAAPWDFR